MMASVSIAARESLRVSTVSLLSSQDRSSAVRKVHLPPTRTRLTPRVAYSCSSCASAEPISMPWGNRAARSFSVSGSAAANSIASSSRSSSGRASVASSDRSRGLIILVARLIAAASFSLNRAAAGRGVARLACCVICDWTLAYIKRSECLVLVDVGNALAHHFQRRGEAGGEHGRRQRRLDHVGNQEFVELHPVGALADETLQRFACLGQRPDRALGIAQVSERSALALLRIGGEQIVQRCRPLRMLDMRDRLGLAACKHITGKLRTRQQTFGNTADGFKTPQPQ